VEKGSIQNVLLYPITGGDNVRKTVREVAVWKWVKTIVLKTLQGERLYHQKEKKFTGDFNEVKISREETCPPPPSTH